MSNQSIIEHKANMYYVEFREDYLLICQKGTYKKPVKDGKKSKASSYCKALILAILEHWTNDKRGKGTSLAVYMSIPQWIAAMYDMFGRNVVIDSLDELIGEGLISKEPYKMFGRDSFQYLLNYTEVNRRIKALPDRDPMLLAPQVHPFTSNRDQLISKRVAVTSKPDAVTNQRDAVTSNHNIESTYIPIDSNKEESTLPALATTPTASSHDEDAHALSSQSCSLCSEQEDIQPCRECGTRLCFEHRRDFPDETGSTRILCVSCLQQHNRAMVETPSTNTELLSALGPVSGKAEPLIASATPTAEPAPPKAARKPCAPKPVDDGLQARIERVYAFFDTLGQEVTEDNDYHYRHTKKATEAIVEWLKSNPTEAILREVYLKLWNTPADQRSGFDWQQNMSIVAVLGQYDRMALAIKASRKGSKSNLHLVASASRDSGLKSYSREELLRLPV